MRLAPLSLLLLTAPAAAAPTRLDALLARGETLTRAADPACAVPLETAALAAEHSDADYARALAALGLCREVQQRFADAHGLVSRALEGAPAETTPAGKTTRWTTLRAALRRLDERVARVLVTWDDGALFVDGKPVGGVSGRVMAVDPGRRTFEVRKGGKTIAAQEVEARAGDLPAVHLRAPQPTAPQRLTPTIRLDIVPPKSSPLIPSLTPRGIAVGAAYAAGAVAVVSGIVAGVLEAQRVSLRSGLAPDACPTPDASARCAELRQVFEQSRGARNVALVAAGVAVAAGGVAVGLHFKADKVAPVNAGITIDGSW
jgi:hypothetical protein